MGTCITFCDSHSNTMTDIFSRHACRVRQTVCRILRVARRSPVATRRVPIPVHYTLTGNRQGTAGAVHLYHSGSTPLPSTSRCDWRALSSHRVQATTASLNGASGMNWRKIRNGIDDIWFTELCTPPDDQIDASPCRTDHGR
jgi:hypothetical protein